MALNKSTKDCIGLLTAKTAGNAFARTKWALLCACCIVIPLAAAAFALIYVGKSNNELYFYECNKKAAAQMNNLSLYADTDSFICKKLDAIFNKCASENELKAELDSLQKSELADSFVIWQPNGRIFFNNAKIKKDADLLMAWLSLRRLAIGAVPALNDNETTNLRKILGPHFFAVFHKFCYKGDKLRLIRGDASEHIKPAWLKTSYKFGALVFVKPEYISSLPGIKEFLQNFSEKNMTLSVYSKKKWLGASLSSEEKEKILDSFNSFKNPIVCKNKYFFKKLIGNDLRAVCSFKLSKPKSLGLELLKYLLGLSILLCFICFAVKGYGLICPKKAYSASLHRQTLLLLLMSDLIIFLTIGSFAYEYFNNYRQNLQNKCFDDGIKYLQTVDEIYLSEYSRQLKAVSDTLDNFEKTLRGHGINRNLIIDFLNDKYPLPMHLFISGTATNIIGSKFGIIENEKFIDKYKLDNDYVPSVEKLSDSIAKVSRYYLGELNNKPLSDAAKTKTEMIIEALGANNAVEMLQNFWASDGKIAHWGLGEQIFPIYSKALKNAEALADYLFICIYKPIWLERAFIKHIILNLNRNPFGIKTAAVGADTILPIEATNNKDVLSFAASIRSGTASEMGFCEWYGEKSLMVGLKCKKLNSMCLIAFFSMKEIDEKVKKAAGSFALAVLVVLLVPILLGFYIAKRLYESIFELQMGVVAIQGGRFNCRLRDMGHDELGELAKVFNSALIDLEEIKSALDIQAKLSQVLVQPAFIGSFEYFERQIVLADYPSNIFAAEKLDDTHTACIIGNVCALKMGSSLIISFMYAYAEKLKHTLFEPERFLLSANKVLLQMTGGGQKYVAMQVILLDSAKNTVKIANAGLGGPVILKRGTAKFVKLQMPSCPLGAKDDFAAATAEIELKTDEILVSCTKDICANNGLKEALTTAAQSALGVEQFVGSVCERLADEKTKAADDITLFAAAQNAKTSRC